MEFKGTQGQLEKVYMGDVCIGIGVKSESSYYKMTANSVLPDVESMDDDEVDRAMIVVDADMTLYSKSKEMLETLTKVSDFIAANESKNYMVKLLSREVPGIQDLIKSAMEVGNDG